MLSSSSVRWLEVCLFLTVSIAALYSQHKSTHEGHTSKGFVLTNEGIGPVILGMRRIDFRVSWPSMKDSLIFDGEGNGDTVSVFRLEHRVIALLEWGRELPSTLKRIVVIDQSVRTIDSIGVGSTVRALRKKYGKLDAAYDDSGVFVWSKQSGNLSFVVRFDARRFLQVPESVREKPEVIPNDARVKKVIVSRD